MGPKYDFLLKEYDQVSSAYFGLRTQISEWFKAYITMVALPLTVVAAVLKIGNDPEVDVFNLPSIIGLLLFFVAILGWLVCLTIISMRMEMIYYARVINTMRNYYSVRFPEISKYLLLPKDSSNPPYYERLRVTHFQTLTFSIVDSLLFYFGIASLFDLTIIIMLFISSVFLLLHFVAYRALAFYRECKDSKSSLI